MPATGYLNKIRPIGATSAAEPPAADLRTGLV
jgi:hypothetical protein